MLKIMDKACAPTKGTEFNACVDLYAREDVVIGAGETVLVPLGVKIDLRKLEQIVNQETLCEYDYINDSIITQKKASLAFFFKKFMRSHQLNLHIRSSMSAKHGLIIANGTGIIDMDYTGEIMICLHNPIREKWTNKEDGQPYDDSQQAFTLKKGQLGKNSKSIAIAQISLVEHKSYLFGIDSAEKRDGGFGSTGK